MTWLFGFLIIIPTPPNAIYLGFVLAFIFCILNAFQGVFIFIWAVLIRKLQLRHFKKLKYEKPFNSETGNSSNTDTFYSRKRNDEHTQNTNVSESELEYSSNNNPYLQGNDLELNPKNRNIPNNEYVNIDDINFNKNVSMQDEYNRNSVKTLIRINENISKEIDLSKVHLEYHRKDMIQKTNF